MSSNGGDLGTRVAALEQRVETLVQSLNKTIKIVADSVGVVASSLDTINAEIVTYRRRTGRDTSAYTEISEKLWLLAAALEDLRGL